MKTLAEVIETRKNKFDKELQCSCSDMQKGYKSGWKDAYQDIKEILERNGFTMKNSAVKLSTSVADIMKITITADVVEVVRCKECNWSSEPKTVSRLELYSNGYDVRFCKRDKRIVCGTHFCGYGKRRQQKEEDGRKKKQ